MDQPQGKVPLTIKVSEEVYTRLNEIRRRRRTSLQEIGETLLTELATGQRAAPVVSTDPNSIDCSGLSHDHIETIRRIRDLYREGRHPNHEFMISIALEAAAASIRKAKRKRAS